MTATGSADASERALLGAAISSTDLAITIVEQIKPDDLRDPVHRDILDVLTGLVGKGEQVSPAIVLTELAKARKLVGRVDGLYLHGLVEEGALPSQVGYHVKDVKAKAWKRGMWVLGTRCQQASEQPDRTPEEDAELLHGWLDELVGVDSDDGTSQAADLIQSVLDEIEQGSDADVVPTGFSDLDALMSMRPGQLIVVGARPGSGKALALDTPLPTPTGWTTMKDVAVGDYLIGMDGKSTRVTFATEVMYDRPCYEVEFSDGTVIVADAEHLWFTETRASRRAATPPGGYEFKRSSPYSWDQRWKSEKPSVKTTREIRATLRVGSDSRLNHSVQLASPLALPAVDLPIHPYLLGYWLGDGNSRGAQITVSGEDLPSLLHQVDVVGYHHGQPRGDRKCWRVTVSTQPVVRGGHYVGRDTLNKRLRDLGLLGNKHIPHVYLRASETQRRALLAGLLDSDGTISTSGHISFEVTSKRLAEQFFDLAASLGYKPEVSTKQVNGRSEQTSTCYRVGFVTSDKVFRLDRKNARIPTTTHPRGQRRFIVAVRPIESVPVRCITVDNNDHMYLASHAYVPTHNTTFGMDTARHVGIRLRWPVYFLTLEMSRSELMKRMISAEARVSLHAILHHRVGQERLTDDDWRRIVAAADRIQESSITIDDASGVGLARIRARLRHMKRTTGVRLAVIDYLGILTAQGRTENRQQIIADLTRGLKQIAREIGIPIILLAQLNRQVMGRPDRRPMASDLKDSGAIEADADVVILLHREDMYEKESPRAGEADFIVDKHRSGPQSTVTVAFQGHYSRFVDMAADPAPREPLAKGHLRAVP